MTVRIIEGDALAVLRTLPSESVQCVVTSPPYFQLRDYGVEGQIGLEPTPVAFIAALMGVFDEIRRVLRTDGVCFVNLGDSYAGSGKGPTGHNGSGNQEQRQGFVGAPQQRGGAIRPKTSNGFGTLGATSLRAFNGIPAKSLMLIPERFALAMLDTGWIARSRIAWCKRSAMPESVRDRPTSAWEHIWMFSKSRTYYYDADAVRQPMSHGLTPGKNGQRAFSDGFREATGDIHHGFKTGPNPAGANLRNFWLLGPEPSSLEHYAGFPAALPKRCILAGTSEKGACPACGAPWVRSISHPCVACGAPIPQQGKSCMACGYVRDWKNGRQATPEMLGDDWTVGPRVPRFPGGFSNTNTGAGWAPNGV